MLKRFRNFILAVAVALSLVGVTAAVVEPTKATAAGTVTSLWFGDSIIEGCCGTTATTAVGEVASARLGWATPVRKGSGGTGYLSAGSVPGRVPYTQRIGPTLDAMAVKPQVIIIEGGNNDPSTDLVKFRSAVAQTFTIARTKAPLAKIYIVGPYSANGWASAKVGVVREEAAKMGFGFIDISTYLQGRPELLWTDKFHPNAEGHKLLGDRIAGELALAKAPR